MRNSILYHGTPSEARAKGIILEGIQPNLSTTEGLAKPVDGCVYLTVNLRYALIYLLGGDMLGSKLPSSFLEECVYGYLFEIPGSELSSFNPDEDQVGQALYDGEFSWVEKYQDFLREQEPLLDDNETCFSSSLWEQVADGDYSAWIKAGHLLLTKLTEEEKHDIVMKYGNVANRGMVKPQAAWRFDKRKCQFLKEDGSNFFDLAEKVY